MGQRIDTTNARGLTASFGIAGYANSGAADTNISSANAVQYAINGVLYSAAARAAAAAPTLDFRSQANPVAITGGNYAVVLIGFDSTGTMQFCQGPVRQYTATANANNLVFPELPDDFAPVAYQVVKNKNASGTAAWTFGTSLFNAANVAFEAAVPISTIPNDQLYNTTA